MVKKALTPQRDFIVASRAWRKLTAVLGTLSMEFTKLNADAMTILINEILSSGQLGMEEPLVMFLMDWVAEYERQFVHLEEAPPADVLRHLMQSNGLKQADLASELGGQSVVSAILRGKREINAGQAVRLGRRFGVSSAVFIESSQELDRGNKTVREAFKIAGSNLTSVQVILSNAHVPLTYVQ